MKAILTILTLGAAGYGVYYLYNKGYFNINRKIVIPKGLSSVDGYSNATSNTTDTSKASPHGCKGSDTYQVHNGIKGCWGPTLINNKPLAFNPNF